MKTVSLGVWFFLVTMSMQPSSSYATSALCRLVDAARICLASVGCMDLPPSDWKIPRGNPKETVYFLGDTIPSKVIEAASRFGGNSTRVTQIKHILPYALRTDQTVLPLLEEMSMGKHTELIGDPFSVGQLVLNFRMKQKNATKPDFFSLRLSYKGVVADFRDSFTRDDINRTSNEAYWIIDNHIETFQFATIPHVAQYIFSISDLPKFLAILKDKFGYQIL